MDDARESNFDRILRDLERSRALLKQSPEPDAQRELERLIRNAEDRLREMEEKRSSDGARG
jgi:hypothetical protein